jgi:hypothetical protein
MTPGTRTGSQLARRCPVPEDRHGTVPLAPDPRDLTKVHLRSIHRAVQHINGEGTRLQPSRPATGCGRACSPMPRSGSSAPRRSIPRIATPGRVRRARAGPGETLPSSYLLLTSMFLEVIPLPHHPLSQHAGRVYLRVATIGCASRRQRAAHGHASRRSRTPSMCRFRRLREALSNQSHIQAGKGVAR